MIRHSVDRTYRQYSIPIENADDKALPTVGTDDVAFPLVRRRDMTNG